MDGLTVRGLARQAGLYPTAVTYHLGGLESIRYAVADAVVASIEVAPECEPDDWEPWLRLLAESGYDVMAACPGVYRFIARVGPTSPSQITIIDSCMQVLTRAGLSDRDAALAYGAFIGLVGGSADTAANLVLFADERAQRKADFRERVEDVVAVNAGLGRALPTLSAWDHREAFLFSLGLLLDGIRTRLG